MYDADVCRFKSSLRAYAILLFNLPTYLLIGVYVQLSSIATLYVKLALGGRKASVDVNISY
jgi:hypothetical protein